MPQGRYTLRGLQAACDDEIFQQRLARCSELLQLGKLTEAKEACHEFSKVLKRVAEQISAQQQQDALARALEKADKAVSNPAKPQPEPATPKPARMRVTKSFTLLLLAACGIALRGRLREVVESTGGSSSSHMPSHSRSARAGITAALSSKVPLRAPTDKEPRRPSQNPREGAGVTIDDEACCALPDQCFVLQPILCPVGVQMEMWLALRHPPVHVAAALAVAHKWDCLLEFGPHCLAELATATKATVRGRILSRGLHVPGGKRKYLHELPLAAWRATSGSIGHLELAEDDTRSTYAGRCKLSSARNDGLALREVHHPFLLHPGAAQKAISADLLVAADWPPLPPDYRRLPAPKDLNIRASDKDEDVDVTSGRPRARLQQMRANQQQSFFWVAADAGVHGLRRFSGSLGSEDMICAPARTVSRSNIAFTLRGDRCGTCVGAADALRADTSVHSEVVHPYAGSFLKVDRAPAIEWDAFKDTINAGKRYPVYVKLPRNAPPSWYPAGATSMMQCSACGAAGQLPRMLAHVATCRAGSFGRVDATTCRKLASLASPDGQNAEGGSSRAPAAKTTSQDYDLAQLRVSVPAAASVPVPDTTWSRGLRFRILVLNAGRCLQSSWPLLVHEIRGILPLVIVVSEAETPDASRREKIHRLIQWALQGRYKALFTRNTLVLIAHSLRPAPNTELAEIAEVPDMVAAVVAHPQLAGLLVLGYLPPTGSKYREQRIQHHRTLLEFLRHRKAQLVGAAGDLNMSTGSVWNDGRARSPERQAIWDLLLAAGLTNCLVEQEVAFPYAESQPGLAFLKPRPNALQQEVYAEVEPPSFMKLDGSSHLRITAGIRNPPEGAARDLPTGRLAHAAEDAALERRFIWATETAPENMLNKATDACVAAAAGGTFSASTIAHELSKAGWRSPVEEKQLKRAADDVIDSAPDVPVEATHDLAERASRRLNPRAAPGLDGVAPSFLLRAPRLVYSLVLLFVSCINLLADLPWSKVYGVTWLYKVSKRGASKFLPKFFRPIALISVVDKLAEAVILEQILPLVASVRDNYAFHAGTSPAVGLLRALARTLLSSAPYIGVIIADISGGYENAILLDVLRALKFRGASKQILRAVWFWFLNRLCRIMLDGRLSAAFVIAEGLGQGTLLSPVLFRVVVEFWMEAHNIVTTLIDTVT
eukprot:g10784.t1